MSKFTNGKLRPKRQTSTEKSIASRSFREKFLIYTGKNLHWTQVIFRVQKSVTLAILPWALLCCGYAFVASLLHNIHFEYLTSIISDSKVLPNVVLSFNIVLSLLLVSRTNAANERFWEGRKLWGALVNAVRNLARGIWIVVEEQGVKGRAEKEAALRLVVAFTVAMKLHLRREYVNHELEPLMSSFQYFKLQEVDHPSLEIAFWIGDYLQYQYNSNRLNVYQLSDLHKLLDTLVDILGGCERILKTPMPLIYTVILKTLLSIYFVLLPWELVDGLTWWTGPIMFFIALILLSIDEIGAEIEEPFGHDPNNLPLDVICNTMLCNVEELIVTAPSNALLCEIPTNRNSK